MTNSQKVHFMGILGSGISYAAALAKLQGFEVDGCDQNQESEFSPELASENIRSLVGHDPKHLGRVDTLVISPAIARLDPDNPEVLTAKQDGIDVLTWQEFVGKYLMKNKVVIGVAGTHGKGTTTSMLALMMESLGLDPTVGVGAMVAQWGTNYRFGKGKYFVIESDEYNNNFLNFDPSFVGITNVEMDHPEFFQNNQNLLNSFKDFVGKMGDKGCLVINIDPALSSDLLKSLELDRNRIITYSITDSSADISAMSIVETEKGVDFEVKSKIPSLNGLKVSLGVLGRHNVSNALNALGLLGLVAPDKNLKPALQTLETFHGVKRRFEVRKYRGITFIDDYAHHPTEVRVSLDSANKLARGKRLFVVFQPHTYSRTEYFLQDFISIFQKTTFYEAIITDIFAAREQVGEISSQKIVDQIGKENVKYIATLEQVTKYLRDNTNQSDVVLVMGAGDVNKVSKELING